jgi:tetratricopeptide (TPR) repeat protein
MMGLIKKVFNVFGDTGYQEAIKLFGEHRYTEAIERFEDILRRKTSSNNLYHNLACVYISQSHRNLGIVHLVMGNFSTAYDEFEKALEVSPDYMELNHFIGICQNNMGDFEGALKSFNTLLEIDPTYLPTKLKLGIALHNLRMWEKAIGLYNGILQSNPEYADIHYHLGLACMGQGKIPEAVTAFGRALDINPHYVTARTKKAVGEIYLERFEDAEKNLVQVLAAHPDYADVHYYMGLASFGMNRIDAATGFLVHALKLNPTYKEARIKLGILYCYVGSLEEGKAQFDEACSIDPLDEQLSITTNAVRNMIATSCSPEERSDIFRRFLIGNREILHAIPELNRSVQIGLEVSEMVGIILSVSEQDASLCEMLLPFVKDHVLKYPDYPDLHNSLGILYRRVGRLTDAEASFREAVRLNNQCFKSRINLFFALKDLGRNDEAIEEGEYLGRKAPYPDLYCALGEIYLIRSEADKALEALNRALQLNPRYPLAYYLLSGLYEGQGDIPGAIAELERCQDAGPSGELREKAAEALKRLQEKTRNS